MKILMVMTSHDRLGDTGKKTGFWLEEFAAPYYVFKEANAVITVASPLGGMPPLDPKSDLPHAQTPSTRRYQTDSEAQDLLKHSQKLPDISAKDYDAVFYPGGHGPLWDLAEDPSSIALIETMYGAGKPIAFVCHAPGVLIHVKAPDRTPLVQGKEVTGFTNSEEQAAGLTTVVPFLLEDMLRQNGANFSHKENGQDYVVTDGLLVTGQNPASSESAARVLVGLLSDKK